MSKTKQPAAQVKPAKKAAALKAANATKRAQPVWLRGAQALPTDTALPPTPERTNAAYQSQGSPRLLDKAEVLTVTRVSFPTIWKMMRNDQFPRARILGGKSMWLSSEIERWMAQLPIRPLKGDAPNREARG